MKNEIIPEPKKKNTVKRLPMKNVQEFGELKVGAISPEDHKPGYEVQIYENIPPSRFYVELYDSQITYSCFFDGCGVEGSIVGTMKGWLSGSSIPEDTEVFGIQTDANGVFTTGDSSLLIIADQNSIIVGLYLNAQVSDLPKILESHPKIADFDLLEGIAEIGPLKVGGVMPQFTQKLQPIDSPFKVPHKFSTYWIRTKPAGSGCGYYECGYYVEILERLGGRYFEINQLQPEIVESLGISANQLQRGEVSFIILTDANGKILALHPNTQIRDIVTILQQHPEVGDLKSLEFYD